MARTFRRCKNKKSRKPVPLSTKVFPGMAWLAEHRKTIMADDPWLRRFRDIDTIKSRTKRRRRMKERLLKMAPDPELLVLPEKDHRWFIGDSIF